MVELPDPRLLRAIQERDAERTERIHHQRAAQALKLRVDQLQRQVSQLTTDRAAVTNRPSRESNCDLVEHGISRFYLGS
jgi:hypothetical protein